MICGFFLCKSVTICGTVKMLWFSSTAFFSDRKVNLVGTFFLEGGGKNIKYPIVFKSRNVNKKKLRFMVLIILL